MLFKQNIEPYSYTSIIHESVKIGIDRRIHIINSY